MTKRQRVSRSINHTITQPRSPPQHNVMTKQECDDKLQHQKIQHEEQCLKLIHKAKEEATRAENKRYVDLWNANVSEFHDILKAKEAQLGELENKLTTAQHEVQQLRQALLMLQPGDKMEVNNNNLSGENMDMNNNLLTRLQKRISETGQEKLNLQQQLINVRHTITELTKQKNSLQEVHERAKQQLKNKERLSELSAQKREQNGKNAGTRLNVMRREFQSLEHTITNVRNKHNQIMQERKKMEAERNAIQQQLQQATQAREELSNQLKKIYAQGRQDAQGELRNRIQKEEASKKMRIVSGIKAKNYRIALLKKLEKRHELQQLARDSKSNGATVRTFAIELRDMEKNVERLARNAKERAKERNAQMQIVDNMRQLFLQVIKLLHNSTRTDKLKQILSRAMQALENNANSKSFPKRSS